ncbi:hypothetical protein ISN45_Aa04g015860 [Arabidopsis thaliana x Arabidopsis arenosa]|uniref:Uncharacterized protein n=1 Tax=Arabidopsis thaliana x Arabidopsis arenosa TaxID=1240361 RepID=A0A8T2AAT1_9BRAS|nr:hypothetical protein ISN45_Aa04g015860 [Arabidopsis thaliana x Arabidopsis arenosa]
MCRLIRLVLHWGGWELAGIITKVASYAPLVGFASGDLGFFSEVRSALFPAISASTARLFGFVSGNLGYNSEKFRVNWIALMAPSGRALSVKVPGTGVK